MTNSYEQVDSERLEDYLELRHLEQLRELFIRHRPPKSSVDASIPAHKRPKSPGRSAGYLTPEEFKAFVHKVVGKGEYDSQLDKLFVKLDTSCDGYVDWSEFCTYILLYLKENDYISGNKEVPFKSDPKIRHILHNRQEPTSRLLVTDNPHKIITISKDGAICVWDNQAHFEANYRTYSEEENPMGGRKRFQMWVMDATFMRNCHKVVISTSGRDLKFLDFGSGVVIEDLHLYGLPNVVNCMDYYYDRKSPGSPSSLFGGDECGNLYHITFLKPTHSLFDLPHHRELIQKVWYNDLDKHASLVQFKEHTGLHSEAIQCIRYLPDKECIISCSLNPQDSIILYDIVRKHTVYTFKVRRGVECFSLSWSVNMLVTGSSDYLLRVWNPYVTNQPTAKLQGHHAPVLSVAIHERLSAIMSYSRDAAIKVWDLKEFTCLQTVQVRTPAMATGKLPEHMYSPMLLHKGTAQVFIAAGDYMVVYKLGKPPEPPPLIPLTHKTQLCAAVINNHFRQVVTGSDDSTIISWDLETGAKNLVFNNAHDGEEITYLTFDATGRKLISAARNGTVKIWNFQNGHNMNLLEAVAEAEVTGVIPIEERHCILTVGWSRHVAKYETLNFDTHTLKVDLSWQGGVVHREDILAMDCARPQLLATASYDGEIIIWSLETELVLVRLRKGQMESLNRSMNRLQGLSSLSSSGQTSRSSSMPNSRPNSRHRKSHRAPSGGVPPPVDKLIFLQSRVPLARRGGAVLVSSEAGTLRWWGLYGRKQDLGHFYAASEKDESVLAICSDKSNDILVTGDTRGTLSMWDIQDYCTSDVDEKTPLGSSPPLLRQWRAHEAAVVSLDMMEHEIGPLLVTASTDCSSRLFTSKGQWIGIFGQKTTWNLHKQKTWIDKPQRDTKVKFKVKDDDEDSATEPGDHPFITKLSREVTPADGDDNDLSDLSQMKADAGGPKDDGRGKTERSVSEGPTEKDIVKPKGERAAEEEVGSESRDDDTQDDFENIRQALLLERSKSMLGEKADLDFERIRISRQHRREHYSDVNASKTMRFGPKCSPYAALSTMNFNSMVVRQNLPVPGMRIPSASDVHERAKVSAADDDFGPLYREMDPFLKNLEELQTRREHTWAAHTEANKNPGKLASLAARTNHTAK